ncbi:MAG: V-type ATP synthase subunit F [Clostridia bacterium]|nr:V-type ATP synthase subunit F [Clostridia bacterium]
MAVNKRIGILGDYDSISAFKVLGLDPVPVKNGEEAEDALKALIAREYTVIFITENFAEAVSDILDEYRTKPTPAIIPIPSVSGSTGFGVSYVKKAVEQAVGSDIIFNQE